MYQINNYHKKLDSIHHVENRQKSNYKHRSYDNLTQNSNKRCMSSEEHSPFSYEEWIKVNKMLLKQYIYGRLIWLSIFTNYT